MQNNIAPNTNTLRPRLILSGLLLCIVIVATLVYALFFDRAEPAAKTSVVVLKGSTFAEAARQLEKAGVVQAWRLRVLERLQRHPALLSAGQYDFPAHMSAHDVFVELQTPALPVAHWITIPEGFTVQQIGDRLREDGFTHARDFSAYALHHGISIGGVRTKSLEGFLFPSTYLITNDADSRSIADLMVAEFRRRVPHDLQKQAARLHETVPEVVTVASLIEREAQRDEERPIMAGVYYHRLSIGMPLEVDATLEYAFAKHHTVITGSDLAKDTPYNSYKRLGLPPTPIANPGLPSILAALHPSKTPYLYYVYRGGGRHAFAATLQEHNYNVNRYLR